MTAAIREQVIKSQPAQFAFDRENWEAEIARIYSTSAPEVIALQNKMGWYEKDDFANVSSKWDAIVMLLAEAPTQAQMLDMVRRIGLNYQEFVDMYGMEKIENAIRYAKDLKDRYSVLWLAYQYCGRNTNE